MGLWLLSPDRMATAPELQGDDYFQHLAQGVRSQVGSQRIDVVGFSIGAFVALQVCRHLGAQVRRLHLISAAAPLESGHFLPHMAGRTLFRLARSSPGWLDTHTSVQRLLARRAPQLLLRLMFSTARGDDRALVVDPIFRRWITPLLQGCLVDHRPGYLRELRAYAAAWSSTLPTMTVPTPAIPVRPAGTAPLAHWRRWWRKQSPTRQDRFVTLGPLLAVMLFLAAVIAAFAYLRIEEIDREQQAVKRDVEYAQQRLRDDVPRPDALL